MKQIVSLKSLIFLLSMMFITKDSVIAEEVETNKIKSISVIPIIIGGSDDPFSKGSKALSFKGYGELVGKDASNFISDFENKKNISGFADQGIDMELIVQFENQKYQRFRLRMTSKSLLYISNKNGDVALYELSQESYKVIKSSIITNSQE